MPRLALLLDVDGVLNPYGTVECPEGFTEYDLFPGEEPVRLCLAHGEWISELRYVFDVAWATAWNDDANRLLAPILGIAALSVVTMPSPPFQPRDKVPPIARFAARRPAVWVDDLHPAEAWTWTAARHEPTLLIPIAPAAGLTREVVDQALTWARQTLINHSFSRAAPKGFQERPWFTTRHHCFPHCRVPATTRQARSSRIYPALADSLVSLLPK